MNQKGRVDEIKGEVGPLVRCSFYVFIASFAAALEVAFILFLQKYQQYE